MRHTTGFGRRTVLLERLPLPPARWHPAGMGISRPIVVLVVLAAACGGDADAGPAPGDYFAQLERVTETARTQERGLTRDLRMRLEDPPLGEDRMTVLTVYVDQRARLYRDVVDALRDLDPPEELSAAQQAFLEAWRGQLHLIVAVRDAGYAGPRGIVVALESSAFRDAAAEKRARCEDLQAAVAAAGSDVDLVCDRPT